MKWRRPLQLLFMLITISGCMTQTKDGSVLIPEPREVPHPPPVITQEPYKEPGPTIQPEPVPVPTPDPVEITADIKIRQCLRYEGIVDQWLELEPNEFEYLDDKVLVLSVGAAESGCDMSMVSSAGAIGIMQIIPKPWYAPVDMLMIPRVNIYWGMRILDGAMKISFEEGNDLRYALAYYNCSYESVHTDACGDRGGLNYSKEVLEFWYPRFMERLRSEVQE